MIVHEFWCTHEEPVITATYTTHIDWSDPQAERYDVCMTCGARTETRKEQL